MNKKNGDVDSKVDSGTIRELAGLLTELELSEIEIEANGVRMRVARGLTVSHAVTAAAAPAPSAASAAEAAPKLSGPAAGAVTSPMVGTVYVSPKPGDPPFVKVGDTVKEGDTLLIVEAMKTMNPILATRGGKVSEICVRDAEPVEFGQTLIVLS